MHKLINFFCRRKLLNISVGIEQKNRMKTFTFVRSTCEQRKSSYNFTTVRTKSRQQFVCTCVHRNPNTVAKLNSTKTRMWSMWWVVECWSDWLETFCERIFLFVADKSSRADGVEVETVPRSVGTTESARRMPEGVQKTHRKHRSHIVRAQNGHGKSDFEFQHLWSAAEFGGTVTTNGPARTIRKAKTCSIECATGFHCTVSCAICEWTAKCQRISGNLHKVFGKYSERIHRFVE